MYVLASHCYIRIVLRGCTKVFLVPFSIPPAPFGGVDSTKLVHGGGGVRRRDDDGRRRQNTRWLTAGAENRLAAGDRDRTGWWCTSTLLVVGAHRTDEFRDDG